MGIVPLSPERLAWLAADLNAVMEEGWNEHIANARTKEARRRAKQKARYARLRHRPKSAAEVRRRRAYTKKHYAENREARKAQMRGYSARRRLAETRGGRMTAEEYATALAAQGGGCAICGVAPKPSKRFDVDHDHATGQTRGLLCERDNVMLGMAGDSAERLRSGAAYLERWANNGR